MTTKITEKNISTLKNLGISWQSVVTASTLTAVAGRGYFIDTTSNACTITLPTSPTSGDTVVFKDYARTFATNNITIQPGSGEAFDGVTSVTKSFSTNGQTISCVYMDATKGWSLIIDDDVVMIGATFISATGGTITTSGNFKIHTFTGDDTFVVATVGNPAGSNGIDYLVVAGGGGGGDNAGGAGGAGGYRTTFPSPTSCSTGPFPISATTYPITVGGGGTGGIVPLTSQTNGSPSIFSTITSAGGGYGGGGGGSYKAASPGGSGGGGSTVGQPNGAGGTGNSPPTSPSQGNSGGTGNPGGNGGGGGGGGAGAVGSNASGFTGGPGGAGSANSITGSSVSYAGGGGGSQGNNGSPGVTSPGGSGGGGPSGLGSSTPTNSGVAGTANTGGGGGGAGLFHGTGVSGGAGGKGVVIIRYKFQG